MFVTRFAPSPTGLLHLGHAFSALTAHDAARAASGRFLLRIEDIDQGRARPAFEAALIEDLSWLGVRWDAPPRRQSDHMADYAGALARLIAQGAVYRCFRTRKEILAAMAGAPHGSGEVFFGARLGPDDEAERLTRGEMFAWRLDAARARDQLGPLFFDDETGRVAVDPLRLGDAVVARKDFPASYHLASVWDDARDGVTHVIRGADLRDSAHLHVVLQSLLGLPTPRYAHHRLIVDEAGKRLAKRDSARTLRSLRDGGKTPANIRAMVGL
ncbi:MAG: tRNA glutamyl-Q(34) synthetase GluQRS [Hyphomonadaceae bacterium]|nr:tRNA glutamyl-Q(34) synthetase GluQRS [Hyphomonadaceae bacterium]